MNTEKAESKTCKDKQPCSCLGPCEHPDKKESWVNIYKDARGRFLGDEEYSSESEAFKNRDIVSTYFETVKITRYE